MNSANASNEVSINRIGTIVAQVAGPALAILAVSSVAFFLIEVMYSGPLVGRCKWIFALFSFAAVLISRISIEEGRERASMYGFFLGMATLMVASRFMQGNPLMLAGILAFVWWIAGRLTWDCTFIDETRDASGQGMIDLAIDRVNRSRDRNNPATRSSVPDEEATHPDLVQPLEEDSPAKKTPGPWDKFVKLFLARRQPNTPGLWAFYFLLMGLPLFGFGQIMMGMRDEMGHRAAAIHFFVYMTSLLCLLMLTSVLGLHRYLQKNNSSVPASIARRWIITGTILAITVIGFCYWLPRPTARYSLASWLPKLSSQNLDPSDSSAGNDGQKKSDNNSNMNSGPDSRDDRKSEKGEGEKDGDEKGSTGNSEKSDDGSPTDQKGGGQSSGEQQSSTGSKQKSSSESQEKSRGKNEQSEGKQKGKSEKSQSKQGESGKDNSQKSESEAGKSKKRKGMESPNRNKRKDAQKDKKEKQSGSSSGQKKRSRGQPPNESQKNKDKQKEKQQQKNNSTGLFDLIGKFARLIIWLVAAAVLCFFAIRHREQIMPWIRSFLAELADFWNRLWNRKKKKPAAKTDSKQTTPKSTMPLPGFDQYQNPFATNAAQTWSPERLVQYTFQAFEAWSRDRQCPRDPEQTAHEFALNTGRQHKPLADEAVNLANLYSQLAYAGGSVSRKSAMTLSRLWEKLV